MNPEAVREAAARIAGRVRRTPVLEAPEEGPGVVLKLELLQHTGSFKPRGAFNRILGEEDLPDAGVIAASGGNHGAAVAFVASQLGIRCEIFVPEVTPAIKRRNIEQWGAELVVGGPLYQDALEASISRAAETGAREIHAYDHPATVAGQGTMAVEVAEQVPDVTTVLMAAGGGGFIAGAAAWWEGSVDLVCVEPQGSRAIGAALDAGTPVDVPVESVAADSLGARRVGDAPFTAIRRGVTRHVTVTDDAIRESQHHLWSRYRLVAEPGGATALAALRSGAVAAEPGGRVVVVVCGANTDPASVV